MSETILGPNTGITLGALGAILVTLVTIAWWAHLAWSRMRIELAETKAELRSMRQELHYVRERLEQSHAWMSKNCRCYKDSGNP